MVSAIICWHLYVLGIKYLGFNLSRGIPLSSIMLPVTVISAFGIDALAKRTQCGRLAGVTMFAGGCTLACIIIGVTYGVFHNFVIHWGIVAGMLLVSGLLIVQYDKTHPFLLLGVLGLTLIINAYPLMLRQHLVQIATTSPLIEKIRESLPAGSCFAITTPGVMPVLPPNLNVQLGLPSVHSYNSLSSRRYHTLIKGLGGEVQTYGRWNSAIAPDYDSAIFWMSNIGLFLSPTKLTDKNLEFLGVMSGIYLHTVTARMGSGLQVVIPQANVIANNLHLEDPRLLQGYSPIKRSDQGDVMTFELVPQTSSVLILSQKFHRDWQARALDPARLGCC